MKKSLIILFTTLLLFTGCENKKKVNIPEPEQKKDIVSETTEYKTYEFSKGVKDKDIIIKLAYLLTTYKTDDKVDHYEIEYKLYINDGLVGTDYYDYNDGPSKLSLILDRNIKYEEIDSLINSFNEYLTKYTISSDNNDGYFVLPISVEDENNNRITKLLAFNYIGRIFNGLTLKNENITNIENNTKEYDFPLFGYTNNNYHIEGDKYYTVSCNLQKYIQKSEEGNAYEYAIFTLNDQLYVELVDYVKATCN